MLFRSVTTDNLTTFFENFSVGQTCRWPTVGQKGPGGTRNCYEPAYPAPINASLGPYRLILPGLSQRLGRLRESRMPMVRAGMITSTNSSQGTPFFISTWTTDFCRGMRILAGKPWLVRILVGTPQSPPLYRLEDVPACALPLPVPQQSARRNHGQVRQLVQRRDACVGGACVAGAGCVHGLLRRAMPVVGLDKPDGDSRLDPLRSSLCNKTLGAIARSESAVRHWILDPDVFAHSLGVMPRGECGYARTELWNCGGNLSEGAPCA